MFSSVQGGEPTPLETSIDYKFRQVKHLTSALTHSSFANETDTGQPHNERLEFLGDAVLELCVSQVLFSMFPSAQEGALTKMRAKLVNERSLAEIAVDFRLDEYLLLGRGEELQGGRSRASILSDALEALIGAVFLDGGYKASVRVVEKLFEERWPGDDNAPVVKDFKSRLQELTQRLFRERPNYHLAGCTGPEHDKVFEIVLVLPGGDEIRACGGSRRKAEQKAAKIALAEIQDRYMDS